MSWEKYCALQVDGKTIPAGRWSLCSEPEGDFDPYALIYYFDERGLGYGTHVEDTVIHDPVYGQVYPQCS